jgi:hypothetical protein
MLASKANRIIEKAQSFHYGFMVGEESRKEKKKGCIEVREM